MYFKAVVKFLLYKIAKKKKKEKETSKLNHN